jgi:hypothetical protein
MWSTNRCERYFHFRGITENKKVQHVSFYLLDDAQMWYHRLELNCGPPSWNHFVQLIQIQFGLPLTNSLIGELPLLRREGSVDDFCTHFMSLSYRDPPSQKIIKFISSQEALDNPYARMLPCRSQRHWMT